jgi:hypothetical protein
VKIGHIYLANDPDEATTQFASLVEALDRLAVDQHVLVANLALARRLQCCPYVTVGPVVNSPVMAYCLMPDVDLVHIHDSKSGQAGLLLTLARSTPFVITTLNEQTTSRNPLKRSMLRRAQSLISPSESDPEKLIGIYRQTIDTWSELPQDADGG